MSRRFTPDHKATVLALLAANKGDIPRTAQQVGITERTLYRWKRQHLTQSPQAECQPPALSLQADESQEELENALLRRYLRQAALQIASQLSDNIQSPDLQRRVSALDSLLNRLGLMGEDTHAHEHTQTVEVHYLNTEGQPSIRRPSEQRTIHSAETQTRRRTY
ncbi:MAG: transposase [Anaerolineae bacterium]